MTLGELAALSTSLRAEHRPSAAIDVEWHKKPALGAACVALGLMGAALARRIRRFVTRVLAALAVLTVCYWMLRIGEQAADAGHFSPALAMWGPAVAFTAMALALGAGRDWNETTTDNGTDRPLTA